MRRIILTAVAVAVIVSGCGHASPGTPTRTPASAAATPSTSTRPAVVAVDYKAQYLATIAPANTAISKMEQQIGAFGDNPSAADVAKATGPAADALENVDSALLRADWPTAVLPDVKALVTADGPMIGDLRSADTQTVFSASTWEAQLGRDAQAASTAANVVRSDLGLPPPQ